MIAEKILNDLYTNWVTDAVQDSVVPILEPVGYERDAQGALRSNAKIGRNA